MAEKPNEEIFKEDPLEQLLDQESDEEFGLPEFKEHFADSLTPAVLKDWTAKDFASIYVRFRPHLERHARRFLVNPSQVEEVVQDAFLYLMTTLPELDSEVGVLRFLKWKTRLLCLDVIRANSRASFAPIDDQPEFAANLPEMSDSLEHADDAAIVSLALAKLQPRQREALIATLYEEKSTEVVAAQMGLTENAFRQLVFRARSSFKKALVGEAETAGKSVSQILSIAARKAAAESGKLISAAGAFLLVIAIAIGVVPNLPRESESTLAEATRQITSPPIPVEVTQEAQALKDEAEQALDTSEPAQPQVNLPVSLLIAPASVIDKPAPGIKIAPALSASSDQKLRTSVARYLLNESAVSKLGQLQGSSVVTANLGQKIIFQVSNSSGLSATLEYDPSSNDVVTFARAEFDIDGFKFIAVPRSRGASVSVDSSLTTVNLGMSDFLITDATGQLSNLVWESGPLSESRLRVNITFDSQFDVVGSQISFSE